MGWVARRQRPEEKVWWRRPFILFIMFISLCQSNEVSSSMSSYATPFVKTSVDDVNDENDAKGFTAYSNIFGYSIRNWWKCSPKLLGAPVDRVSQPATDNSHGQFTGAHTCSRALDYDTVRSFIPLYDTPYAGGGRGAASRV